MTSVGSRIAAWFRGGDPEGPQKIRAWWTGNDGRPEGLTYSMSKPVTILMVLAAILYPITKGYGSIFMLVLAIFVMGGRAMIERQVRRDVSDLKEARRQYGRTGNADYLEFMELRAAGMLEDNRTLTPATRSWVAAQEQWAKERRAEPAADGARRAEPAAEVPETQGTPDGSELPVERSQGDESEPEGQDDPASREPQARSAERSRARVRQEPASRDRRETRGGRKVRKVTQSQGSSERNVP